MVLQKQQKADYTYENLEIGTQISQLKSKSKIHFLTILNFVFGQCKQMYKIICLILAFP